MAKRVYDYLPTYPATVTGAALAAAIGTDKRTILYMIRCERLKGLAICAGKKDGILGYYRPANADEMEQYLQALHTDIRGTIRVYRACTQTLARMREAEKLSPKNDKA